MLKFLGSSDAYPIFANLASASPPPPTLPLPTDPFRCVISILPAISFCFSFVPAQCALR